MIKHAQGLINPNTGNTMPFSQSSKLPQKDLKIIASIIAEFKDISRKDIKKWRDAIAAATNPENPRRFLLHDLYDYLSADGHLESQLLMRRMATLSTKFMIIDRKTGKEDSEKTKLLEKRWFYNFMQDHIDHAFFGFRVPEFAPGEKIQYELIPPRNVIPEKRFVAFEVSGDKGIYYDPAKDFVIEIGRPKDLGVINKIAPQLIWKKNAQQAWAEFGEKFGMPMITATTNKQDKKEIDRIETMLKMLGEASQAVLPEGTTIDIKETATKGDPYNVYDKQIERCNSEISKAILAGTMVTDNGSSRSQSEVHERNVGTVANADKINLKFTINEDLIPLLIRLGLPFSDKDEFKWDTSEKLTLAELWKIVDGLTNKFNIPIEWISKAFNIPIESIKEEAAKGGAEGNFNNDLNGIHNLSGQNFPNYTSIACCSKHNYVAKANSKDWDNWISKLNTQSESILKQLWNNGNPDYDILEKSILSGQILQDSLFTGWSNRMKIAYDAVDHAVLQSMEYNLFHFSYARGMSELQELNQLLIDKDKLEIRSYSDFKQQAKPLLSKLNDQWLKTEYNHTWAVSQNASAFQAHWREKDTVTKFIQYQTSGGNNVRPVHQLLDGKIFKIDDPEARRLYPPNGYGCVCEFIQYLGSIKNVSSGKDALKLIPDTDKSFLINRGESKKVFEANQFYLKNSVKDFGNKINKLTYKSFKQTDYSKLKDKHSALKLDKSITPDNVKDFFKKEESGNFMPFKDHLNRRMILKDGTFKSQTTGKNITKDELRHQLFPHVKDVLLKPDEVYLRSENNKPQYRYIKMYNDSMLVVNTEISDSIVEVRNWYTAKPIKQGGKDENHVRTGLLIKKL